MSPVLDWTRRDLLKLSGVTLMGSIQTSPSAASQRPALGEKFPPDVLAKIVIPRDQWTPFAPARSRERWSSLPANVRRHLSQLAERALATSWPQLPATYFLDFVRTGDRQRADQARAQRRALLRDLVLGECVEYQGRYLDSILNAIWSICEESYWGSPAHLGMQQAGLGLPDVSEPTVDLFAADTAATLAWCDYLLGPELDRMSPLIRKRIAYEVRRRVLDPCLDRNDFWWMGLSRRTQLNNWTPWICSNWIAANLLLESDPNRRNLALHKALGCLDRFLAGYPDDGGCDEGPGYWNRAAASLFDCLELLYWATAGQLDVYASPLVAQMGLYIVRVHIHNEYFVNFADASPKLRPEGSLLYRYGKRVNQPALCFLGAWAAQQFGMDNEFRSDFHRALPAIFGWTELERAPSGQPLVGFAWMPGLQVMTARVKEGSPDGLFVAAKGGHNAESHNHNDVGNFIVYADGLPAIIDVGVGTYTAKTFSPARYEIWTMQSAWHNLPTINGVMQAPGRQYAARDVRCVERGDTVEFQADIGGAYPAEAGVQRWLRQLVLDRRSNTVLLTDRFVCRSTPRELVQSLITPWPIKPVSDGVLELEGPPGASAPVVIRYPVNQFGVHIEQRAVDDPRLERSWGPKVYRILLRARTPSAQGEWTLEFTQRRG